MALYHSAKGSVNYTIVGNPTIVDGVMTYSNVSNYVRTRQNFLSSYNDYEIVCKCAKRLSTEEIIYCMSTGNNGNLQARLLSNAFRFIPYTFSDYIQISGTFVTDVWYWFKVRRTGNTIYASYSTDGVSWSNEVSKTFAQLTTISNFIAFGARIISDRDWDGTSIDLNETYIKVNGQPWFGVCPVEVKKHQLRGPVGYTKEGSPTIVDGVVSGFSSTSNLKTSINYTTQDMFENNYEFATKITPTKQNNSECYAIRYYIGYVLRGIGIYNNKLTWTPGYPYSSSYLGTKSIKADWTVTTGTTYWLKGITNGPVFSFYYSLDGKNYTLIDSVDYTGNTFVITKGFSFGAITNDAYGVFNGSIDLNETYIKVNGKLWYYQPADTKYIVKDGKLVWADPHIYIDDNGTKTYATQNIAPVPAGFTFGTTTTPSIGYVDMRTQVFTVAPQGATIGRDE